MRWVSRGSLRVRELERLGEHHGIAIDAVRAMQQVGGVQLQEATVERGRFGGVCRQGHHLHAQQHHRRIVGDNDIEIERTARLHHPESRFDFLIRGAVGIEPVEERLDVLTRDHDRFP